MNPRTPIMQFFAYDHLAPGPLRETSAKFAALAEELEAALPPGPEKSTALRKLLEGKDSAVRAALELTSEDQRR